MMSASMRVASVLRWPEGMFVLPGLALAAYLIGGEAALLATVLGLPPTLLLARRVWPQPAARAVSDQVVDRLDAILRNRGDGGRQTGCLVLQFDDPSMLCDRHGRWRQSELLAASIGRLRGALRSGDMLFPLEDGSMVVVLAASHRLDLDGLHRIAARLHRVVQQPVVLGDSTVQVTCCIGFCHGGQISGATGRAVLEAAQTAVDEAMRHRPGAIHAFSDDIARARALRDNLRAEFAAAVADGQIRAHFQPQLSTDSGQVSGMEALARWHHPVRGCLGPGEFLPALDGTDLMDLLGREMVAQSLAALAQWDRARHRVPTVAVNLSAQDLRDPDLPDRLAWALDRHGMAPGRLTVEVLESVVAGREDGTIGRTISRLASLGCGIDLDDFGTGNASITSIRSFALRRLKIDRSFVRGVDSDRDQQKMVMAILSMAEQLGLDTLAEGVESPGEHAMMAQLGCGHVQGYAIARPLPPEAVLPWLDQHRDRIGRALRLTVRARQAD